MGEFEILLKFNPQTPAQCVLVSQLTFTAWKLDQIPHLEHQILSTPLGQSDPAPIDQPKPIDPEAYVLNRLAQNNDDSDTPQPKDPTNQITAAHLLQNTATPLTRLWDYHRRLQARFQSLLRQIQQLKRQQQTAHDQSDKKDRQQRQSDHDALTQCVDEIRERNKARDEAARKERQEAAQRQAPQTAPNNAPAQNEPPPQSEISNPKSQIPSPAVPSVPSVVNHCAPAQIELLSPSQISNPKSEIPLRELRGEPFRAGEKRIPPIRTSPLAN